MATPSKDDLLLTYARKFIREYARPSTIEDLIDVIDSIEATPRDLRIKAMLKAELSHHQGDAA